MTPRPFYHLLFLPQRHGARDSPWVYRGGTGFFRRKGRGQTRYRCMTLRTRLCGIRLAAWTICRTLRLVTLGLVNMFHGHGDVGGATGHRRRGTVLTAANDMMPRRAYCSPFAVLFGTRYSYLTQTRRQNIMRTWLAFALRTSADAPVLRRNSAWRARCASTCCCAATMLHIRMDAHRCLAGTAACTRKTA